VVDRDQQRLRVAESIGAIPVLADDGNLVSQVSRETGGDMADVVFEASGSAAATRSTTDVVAHAGRIVLVGWNQGLVEVDTVTLMRKEVEVLGSRNSLNAFPAVLRLLEDGVIDPSVLVTHRFDLTEVGTALDLLDGGRENALKVLVNAR
jgi:L-gulonate 5-dehydrogenase